MTEDSKEQAQSDQFSKLKNIFNSFALYGQFSYWRSARRNSGQFCIDFLGVSYLENNHIIKVYMENFAEPYSRKEAKLNFMVNRSVVNNLEAKSKVEVGLNSKEMNFIFGL